MSLNATMQDAANKISCHGMTEQAMVFRSRTEDGPLLAVQGLGIMSGHGQVPSMAGPLFIWPVRQSLQPLTSPFSCLAWPHFGLTSGGQAIGKE